MQVIGELLRHTLAMEGLDVTKEVSMGKLLSGQLSRKIPDGCLQMFGGAGFMNEMYVSRVFRDSRLIAIGGGADDVMSEIITKMEGL